MYAQVIFGIPVEGHFDYSVPEVFRTSICPGSRVKVEFGNTKKIGYVVKLTSKSGIKNIRPIEKLIDTSPIIDEKLLLLTKEIADYYCCSWGEALESALPEMVREGKSFSFDASRGIKKPGYPAKDTLPVSPCLLVHDADDSRRIDLYINHLREVIKENKTAIILLPDISSCFKLRSILEKRLQCAVTVLYRHQPQAFLEWLKVFQGEVKVVIGSRSGVFAPLYDLGLIIVDQEQDTAFKQDQVPHYHSREVAAMRAKIEGARLILGSHHPSLDSYYQTVKKKMLYSFSEYNKTAPEIKLMSPARVPYGKKTQSVISQYLQDSMSAVLENKGKILLYMNKSGYATAAVCNRCGFIIKCKRCDLNLVYRSSEKMLSCRYCNYKQEVPAICPKCDAGYIKYTGIGSERVENELSRIFPQARISLFGTKDKALPNDTDIIVSTEVILKRLRYNLNLEGFDLVVVFSVDNILHRIDYRGGEKAFEILMGLRDLAVKKMIVLTSLAAQNCFQALIKNDRRFFYDLELKTRKQLLFPPYHHFGEVKIRGLKENRVREACENLYNRFIAVSDKKGVGIASFGSANMAKLRGKFYWHIILHAASARALSKFIKTNLKDFSHSGIIITVDIDPM